MTKRMRLIALNITANPYSNQTSAAMTNATTNETALAQTAAREGSRRKKGDRAGTVLLVAVGNAGFDRNDYTLYPVESVLKVIDDYRNGGRGHCNGKGILNGDDKVWPGWICLDALLRRFEMDEDLENVTKHILKKGKVSGARIRKGRSNGKDNFVLTTTREPKEMGTYGKAITRQPNRLEPGNRVLYIGETHNDPYGGSMCPPCNN
jgi:hypothetical protein